MLARIFMAHAVWRCSLVRSLASVIFCLSLTATPSSAQPVIQNAAINELTDVVLSGDGTQISFFGRFNSAGPRTPISYIQILAAALLLPSEQGPPTVRGSIPGFSLNLSADTVRNIPRVVAKMSNGPEVRRLREEFYARPENRAQMLQLGFPQAWSDIREILKRQLYSRLSRREGDAVVGPITDANALKAALDKLQQEGTLRQDDSQDIISQGIDRFQAKTGNIFFFPEGTTEALYGSQMYSEPAFYGIPKEGEFSKIVFRADIAIKDLARNVALKQKLPFHLTYMEWVLKNASPQQIRASLGDISAIQAFPAQFSISISPDDLVFHLEKSEMTIRVRPYDPNKAPTELDGSYTRFLTDHFEKYAQQYPDIWNLRELFKIVAIARMLQSSHHSLYVSLSRTWSPPKRVRVAWAAGSLGGGGDLYYLATFLNGGVGLQIEQQLNRTVLAPDIAQRFARAAEMLSAVRDNALRGGCYDGGECPRGNPVGAFKIEIPRGSSALSSATLTKMQANPAGRTLLESEKQARSALTAASETVSAKERALAQSSGAEKGTRQVELFEARQREIEARSKSRVSEIKVQDAAKVIEEVELIPSSPNKK